MSIKHSISPEDSPERLDVLVARLSGLTRSRAVRLIDEGGVFVNGKPCLKPAYKARPGEVVSLGPIQPADSSVELVPQDIEVEILYEDSHLVMVNKPPGLVVYPAAGHPDGTLMNALAHRYGPLRCVGAPLRPGVVHRLDRDTSGVMVVALSDVAYYGLVEQFRDRTMSRAYDVLVYGCPEGDSGEIDVPIGRSATDRKKMSTSTRRGKEARTGWSLLEHYMSASWLRAKLATGRTHQIRVHFASIGHPVLGDRTYGRKTSINMGGKVIRFPRQMLHASTLGIVHPVTGEPIERTVPPPPDMTECIEALRKLK